MAHLACVGSHAINGVSQLHSDLLTNSVLRDFYELWPEKCGNKTNGVAPRRFLVMCNPGLAGLIRSRIGEDWIKHLDQLRRLEAFADHGGFQRGGRPGERAKKARACRQPRQ